MLRIPLRQLNDVRWGPTRRGEPVTFGVPLPRGLVRPGVEAWIEASGESPRPVQIAPVETWADGSLRWVLCDARVDLAAATRREWSLCLGPAPMPSVSSMAHTASEAGVVVKTGDATFAFDVGGAFPVSRVSRGTAAHATSFDVQVAGRRYAAVIERVSLECLGALRAAVRIDGHLRSPSQETPLRVYARVELVAGTGTARISITLVNPRQASHSGGQWDLGDPGSILIASATLGVSLGSPIHGVECAAEWLEPLAPVQAPVRLYQASSGGAGWNGPIHKNREGRVALDFRGYRLTTATTQEAGDRAAPILRVTTEAGEVAVAVPEFWQHSPRAAGVAGDRIEVAFFPSDASDPQELQGGERKTHRVVVAFGADPVSDPALAWCHDPIMIATPPHWNAEAGALVRVRPAGEDPNRRYQVLVDTALDPVDGFDAKRERADEYGWRHFGDVPADHESAFQPPDRPLVSHYNNQYDPIAGCALQFLRTGDPRWWQLMDQQARHVRDIDIYATTRDRALYNGGLFWHTQHYLDAGLSTHRTYPRGGVSSGGPSAEHNYNAGLMWHYFLTGDPASRDAAIGLGQWVLDMDDGRRGPFRWLDRGDTGWANRTADSYGPGRGAGHSILALLVAHRLSGRVDYLSKATALIRRTAHPADPIDSRYVESPELYWSYTAFLQALGHYLDHVAECGGGDAAYVRAVLLHYARWMVTHEQPYLDHPERLEYPTETWAAQDLRKAEVFLWAALEAADDERAAFLTRARFFFDDAVERLTAMPTHVFTRPTVLALSFGSRQGWFDAHAEALPPASLAAGGFGAPPPPFVPQKTRAIRRAKILAAAGFAAAAALVVWWSWL